MAVVAMKEEYGTGSGSGKFPRSIAYRRKLLAWVDDLDDGPTVVSNYASLPKIGQIYATGNDYDAGAFLKGIEIERDDVNELLFHVTLDYDNEEPEFDGTIPPLLRPAKYVWGNRREEFVFPTDTRGNPYVTPAGVPIENPPVTPVNLLVLKITKNVSGYNPVVMNAYADSVNLTPFLGFPAGYAKVEEIAPSELQHETINDVHYPFFTVETTVAFRRIPWHPHRMVAKGRSYKNSAGDLVPADAGGVFTDEEVFLDQAGEKTDAANLYLIERYPFPETNFNGIAQFTGITAGW